MWLTERAQAVEEMTGQLHTAVRLLRLAQDFHPQDTLTRQLSTVASLQDGLQGWHPHLTLHACCASFLHRQAVSVPHYPTFCAAFLLQVHAVLCILLCMLHVHHSRTKDVLTDFSVI